MKTACNQEVKFKAVIYKEDKEALGEKMVATEVHLPLTQPTLRYHPKFRTMSNPITEEEVEEEVRCIVVLQGMVQVER